MEAKDILKQHGFTDAQIQALSSSGKLEEAVKGFESQEEKPVTIREEKPVVQKGKRGRS